MHTNNKIFIKQYLSLVLTNPSRCPFYFIVWVQISTHWINCAHRGEMNPRFEKHSTGRPFIFFQPCNSIQSDSELRRSLMGMRYGIKEFDQLWVCGVLKSLCVFFLFTPEDSIIFAQRATLLWLCPLLPFDACGQARPFPPALPPTLAEAVQPLGVAGPGAREPGRVHRAPGCSPPPTCSTPRWAFIPNHQVNGVVLFSYCSLISHRIYQFVSGTIFSLLLKWQKWMRIVILGISVNSSARDLIWEDISHS